MRWTREGRCTIGALHSLDRRDLRVAHFSSPSVRRRAPRTRCRPRISRSQSACRVRVAKSDPAEDRALPRSPLARVRVRSRCDRRASFRDLGPTSRYRPQSGLSERRAPAVRNNPPLGTVPNCQSSRLSGFGSYRRDMKSRRSAGLAERPHWRS